MRQHGGLDHRHSLRGGSELIVIHANATQAGVETVEFIEGYPEEPPLPSERIAATRGGEPTIEHA